MELKKRLYQQLKKVPKGKVITYKELARSCNSRAYRFVGLSMSKNNNRMEIPCYRVIRSDGKIGHYSGYGGIKAKIKKLKSEGIDVINGRIDLSKFGHHFERNEKWQML